MSEREGKKAAETAHAPSSESVDSSQPGWFDDAQQLRAKQKRQEREQGNIEKNYRVTPFGTFWIMDGPAAPRFAEDAEAISLGDFEELKGVWEGLEQGEIGSIKIWESYQPIRLFMPGLWGRFLDFAVHLFAKDAMAKLEETHPGFKKEVAAAFGALMSRPKGRRLVLELVKSRKDIAIAPKKDAFAAVPLSAEGGQTADGVPGGGSCSVILVDPLDMNGQVVDANGKPIAEPLFLGLGHELIHARNFARGMHQLNSPASDSLYSNREEEQTITAGGLTENDLREEHGLERRYSHLSGDEKTIRADLGEEEPGAQKVEKLDNAAFIRLHEGHRAPREAQEKIEAVLQNLQPNEGPVKKKD